MHVGKSVQVLVLIHLLSICLCVRITSSMSLLFVNSGVHEHDLSLKLLVVSLESFLFTEGLLNCDDKLSSQLLLLIQVSDLIDAITIIVIVHVAIIILT
jgi:hypothetical protein